MASKARGILGHDHHRPLRVDVEGGEKVRFGLGIIDDEQASTAAGVGSGKPAQLASPFLPRRRRRGLVGELS